MRTRWKVRVPARHQSGPERDGSTSSWASVASREPYKILHENAFDPGRDVEIDAKTQLAAVLKLARSVASRAKNGEFDSGLQLGLGMAEYRNHAYAAAENALLTAEIFPEDEHPHLVLTARFYRAMSLYRQDKLKNARELFQSAAKKMKPLPEKPRNPLANQANINDVVVWLAYKEGKALIPFSKPEKPAIAQKSPTD